MRILCLWATAAGRRYEGSWQKQTGGPMLTLTSRLLSAQRGQKHRTAFLLHSESSARRPAGCHSTASDKYVHLSSLVLQTQCTFCRLQKTDINLKNFKRNSNSFCSSYSLLFKWSYCLYSISMNTPLWCFDQSFHVSIVLSYFTLKISL